MVRSDWRMNVLINLFCCILLPWPFADLPTLLGDNVMCGFYAKIVMSSWIAKHTGTLISSYMYTLINLDNSFGSFFDHFAFPLFHSIVIHLRGFLKIHFAFLIAHPIESVAKSHYENLYEVHGGGKRVREKM